MSVSGLRLYGALTVLVLTLALMAGFSLAARAYDCTQADGQVGWLNGTSADDTGCITEAEYAAMYSPGELVEAGVITGMVDNGDGTVTATLIRTGVIISLIADPMQRPMAATPRLEPEAPTVGQVLWGHPGSGGVQEF